MIVVVYISEIVLEVCPINRKQATEGDEALSLDREGSQVGRVVP